MSSSPFVVGIILRHQSSASAVGQRSEALPDLDPDTSSRTRRSGITRMSGSVGESPVGSSRMMQDEPGPSVGELVVVTAEARPDLWSAAERAFRDVWPEYNHHGDVSGRYFGALIPRYAHLQFLLRDAADRIVARGRTIPFAWDGTLADLPAGVDAVGLRALDETGAPTTLSALAAEVAADRQGQGISVLVIAAMAEVARNAGFDSLVAPVRPSWKDRYPLVPIEDYASWVREDGLPFDPWMRVHARLGATTLRPEPHSLQITGSVEEWQRWTGADLPTDGEYVFPGGLAPVTVRNGVGRYWEPNVWMLHRIA
jgi:GNAT superfamily N-acetyltransferase